MYVAKHAFRSFVFYSPKRGPFQAKKRAQAVLPVYGCKPTALQGVAPLGAPKAQKQMAIIPINPKGQTRYGPLGEVLEGWKRKRMKCPKVPISPFRLGLTHSLIDLSTFQVISVKSGLFCLWLLSQIWRGVTIWSGQGKSQLVGVVAKVRLRVIMLKSHLMTCYMVAQNQVFTGSAG